MKEFLSAVRLKPMSVYASYYEIQDTNERKRQDDQDKVVYYLAYPAACDHLNPVFLGFASDLWVIEWVCMTAPDLFRARATARACKQLFIHVNEARRCDE